MCIGYLSNMQFKRHQRTLVLSLIDIALWSMLVPVVIPLVAIFGTLKAVVWLLMKIFRPGFELRKLNDLTVARDNIKEKPIVDIGFVLKVHGEITLDALKQKFSHCFLSDPEKREKYGSFYKTFDNFLGYLCTKKVSLDLHKQIQELNIELEADKVEAHFSKWFHSRYADDDAPRWEMLLCRDTNKTHYVAMRMHHGLIDGFGMLLIVDKLCGQESPYLVSPEPSFSFIEQVQMLFELPRYTLYYLFYCLHARKPLKNFGNGGKHNEFYISWTTLDLKKIKDIRRKLNTSFSTILYVLQTGALRRFLINIGKETEITKTLPVFHTIPKPNHPRTYFTNHWSFIKLNTPFKEPNPVKRIQETDIVVKDFLGTKINVSGENFIGGLGNLMPAKLNFLNVDSPLTAFKASLSSMVRSSEQYTLFGHNVLNIYHTFCVKDLCSEAVLYTTTASHNNQIDVMFAASPELVCSQEDMERMVKIDLLEELNYLYSLVSNYLHES